MAPLAGKSTVTRAFAERLVSWLDTGAMYRSVTWWVAERCDPPTLGDEPLLSQFEL